MADDEIPLLRTVAQARFEYGLAQAEREAGKRAEILKIGRMSVVDGQVVVTDDLRRYQYSVGGEVVGQFDEDTGRYWLTEKYSLAH
jgi:hypothetical protein